MFDQLENPYEPIPGHFLVKHFTNVHGSTVLGVTSVHFSDYVLKSGDLFRLHQRGLRLSMRCSRRRWPLRSTSDDAATQVLVFPGEQLLREIVAALVGVAARPGKVMIDARASGAAEVMREGQNLRGRFTGVDLGLGEWAGGAHCEKFRGDANETREQQLFAIEFRTKAHHGVE